MPERSRGRCRSARAAPRVREHPLLRGVELPERLGTRGNSGPLVFVGGGAPYLYAFDKATGAEVWRGATPFPTNANPMTYRAGSGRQYVVIATGSGEDAALVASLARAPVSMVESHVRSNSRAGQDQSQGSYDGGEGPDTRTARPASGAGWLGYAASAW